MRVEEERGMGGKLWEDAGMSEEQVKPRPASGGKG